MEKTNKQALHNLSNQVMDLFIKDVFAKNQVDLNEAKKKLSDEQRDSLRQSANYLKEQVDSFIDDQNASQTITEKDNGDSDKAMSPLREQLAKKEAQKKEDDSKPASED